MNNRFKVLACFFILLLAFGCSSVKPPVPAPAEAPAPAAKAPAPPAPLLAPPQGSAAAAPAEAPPAAAKEPPVGQSFTATLKVLDAPTEIRALGYEIWFNPKVLRFDKWERRDLLKGSYSIYGANLVAPGKLRMGGIEAGPGNIKQGTSGDLVKLSFTVVGRGRPSFFIRERKDDIKTWKTGVARGDETPPGPGLWLKVDLP